MIRLFVSIIALIASNQAQSSIKSDLGLHLVGTIIHSDVTKSMAAISGNMYRLRERIKSEGEIVKIERFQVQLRNLKTSELEWIGIDSFDPAQAVPSSDIFKSGHHEFQVRRELIDGVTKDLPKFMGDAGTELVSDKNGKSAGFRLNFIKKNGVFANLGLIEGDVLSNVNGLPLDSVSSALNIYQQLKNSSLIELTVKRGDKIQKFTYKVR